MKFLIFCGVVATVLIMCAGCETLPECPVCEECTEGEEDPYLCSKYYADKEEPQLLVGSHDFFLEGEDKITSSKLATKCQACGIYFTYPDYEEHIKTCCP